MRTRSIAFRAAGAVGAAGVVATLLLAPAAGPAHAHDSVTATVSPARVEAGDRVEIRVHGCRSGTGLATSRAFSGPAELRRSDSHDAGRAEARDTGGVWRQPDAVPPDRGAGPEGTTGGAPDTESHGRADGSGSPGSRGDSALHGHTVIKARLSPGSHVVTVRCDGHDHRATGTVHVVGGAGEPARPAHPSPVAPVRAGGGGTAVLAAEERRQQDTDGPGTPHTIIGLVLAGVAAVAVAVRSSRRRRPGSD
ncbi:hypothetical protein ACFQ61_15095 [Streptomyces sp. NPDC056500]|uniref:hypothetical protein n=1 Tax=Streptomyces sp. NPDC056500 TaxID=3345840 RepID=UPI0036766726